MDELLNNLSILIRQSLWLAPLLAVLAGVLTSVTPCSLSSVPLIIGYVGGVGQNDTRRSFWLSVTFAIGGAITFTILGVIASTARKLMGTSSSWWYISLGILMLLCYSLGHSVLTIVAGTSVGFITKINNNASYGTFSKLLKYILGTAILAIAIYMFYLAL